MGDDRGGLIALRRTHTQTIGVKRKNFRLQSNTGAAAVFTRFMCLQTRIEQAKPSMMV